MELSLLLPICLYDVDRGRTFYYSLFIREEHAIWPLSTHRLNSPTIGSVHSAFDFWCHDMVSVTNCTEKSFKSLDWFRSVTEALAVSTKYFINPLNAELSPICHLLVLLGDLTFMGPRIVSIFQYISNKMQRYTVYLYLETALHVSGGASTHHQERIQVYLQHLVFVTPVWQIPDAVDTVVCAPDDG